MKLKYSLCLFFLWCNFPVAKAFCFSKTSNNTKNNRKKQQKKEVYEIQRKLVNILQFNLGLVMPFNFLTREVLYSPFIYKVNQASKSCKSELGGRKKFSSSTALNSRNLISWKQGNYHHLLKCKDIRSPISN